MKSVTRKQTQVKSWEAKWHLMMADIPLPRANVHPVPEKSTTRAFLIWNKIAKSFGFRIIDILFGNLIVPRHSMTVGND